MSLSQSFKKHYPIAKDVNEDILNNILALEKNGYSAIEIVEKLNLPSALVNQCSEDIPELRQTIIVPVVNKR